MQRKSFQFQNGNVALCILPKNEARENRFGN